MKEATTHGKPALHLLKRISAPIPASQSRDPTIIDDLMIDSQIWEAQKEKKNTKGAAPNMQLPTFRPYEKIAGQNTTFAICSSAPKQTQSTKGLHKIKESDCNANSKNRLEKKYEAALEKLSQLQSHYQLRKTEKNRILNHATEGSPQKCRAAS